MATDAPVRLQRLVMLAGAFTKEEIHVRAYERIRLVPEPTLFRVRGPDQVVHGLNGAADEAHGFEMLG